MAADSFNELNIPQETELFVYKEIATMIAQSATPIFAAAHVHGRAGITIAAAVQVAHDIVATSISHKTVSACMELSAGRGTPIDLKTEILDKVNNLATTIERQTAENNAAIEEKMMNRVLAARHASKS